METTSQSYREYMGHTPKKMIIGVEDIIQLRKSVKHFEHYLSSKSVADLSNESDKTPNQKERDILSGMNNEALAYLFNDKEWFFGQYKCLKEKDLPAVDKLNMKTYRMKENRIYRDVTFPAMHVGKTIITEKEYDQIVSVGRENYNHQAITKFRVPGKRGVTKFTTDKKTGITLKSHVHILTDNTSMALYDYRLTDSANVHTYPKTIFGESIHLQAAWNLTAFERTNYVLLAIEKNAPHICQPFILDQETIHLSKQEIRMLLDILYWSRKSGFLLDNSQMAAMKNIYQDKYCYDLSIQETLLLLDEFYQVPTTFFNVTPPNYMKQ